MKASKVRELTNEELTKKEEAAAVPEALAVLVFNPPVEEFTWTESVMVSDAPTLRD